MAEELLRIRGGNALRGETTVQGAKNSALPLMAASLMCSGETVLHRVPRLTDIWTAGRILNGLGCRCRMDGNTAVIRQDGLTGCEIPDAEMRKMRSSIMFLGPMLGCAKECVLTMPGGCELGPRPIDLHLDAMKRLGAEITEQNGRIRCRSAGLRGAKITLPVPSVGVTENVLTAAAAAQGETVLKNAAREPEICDLAQFLNRCGARISGAGEGTVVIEGVGSLHGTEYTVMPDRIAAMTWLCAGAAAGGTAGYGERAFRAGGGWLPDRHLRQPDLAGQLRHSARCPVHPDNAVSGLSDGRSGTRVRDALLGARDDTAGGNRL